MRHRCGMRTILALAAAVTVTSSAVAQPVPTGNFLAISDIHYAGQANQPCAKKETSPALWRAAQNQALKLIESERPAFAIYVGDLPSHCWNRPLSDLQTPLDGLAAIAGTRLKLFYVPGNNDSIAGDYRPFTTGKQTPLSLSTPWQAGPVLNPAPGDMIDTSGLPLGYYAAYAIQKTTTAPALRMIVLNTNMFTTTYACSASATCQAQSDGQLEWLNAQLSDVRSKGEKAILAMHVPPGTDGSAADTDPVKTMWDAALNYGGSDPGLRQGWVQGTYLAIVATYAAEIVGALSSHTHYNEIRRLRDCGKTPPDLGAFTELDLAIPSVTTDHGNRPAMKSIAFDAQYEWTENTTFYALDPLGKTWTSRAGTVKPLSFDADNYRCPQCATGDSLRDRIAALDSATRIGTSTALAAMMIKWVRPGVSPPSSQRQYVLALDATCEAPTSPVAQ
jgi:sphingomyelin phosphodiesterase acid-like 3